MLARCTLTTLLLTTTALFAQTGMEQMMKQYGAAANVKVEDDNDPFVANTFVGSLTMEMQAWENGKAATEKPMEVHVWNSESKTLTEFSAGEGKSMKMLNDLKGKWTYMLMEDAKGGKMAMKTHKKKVTYTGDDSKEQDDWKVTTTGETKTIDGHVCTKVVGSGKEGTWTAWVAKDLQIDLGQMMGGMGSGGKNASAWNDVKGFPLEMEMKDEKGNTTMRMQAKDIHVGAVDEAVFSLAGYQVMEMPSLGR
ncbi:MAG: DUF4412 domain-containing protein [Flavobacteriales bacterium]|nr:DUF4412 domain-containing protein [Flavobacteriales bacterium]